MAENPQSEATIIDPIFCADDADMILACTVPGASDTPSKRHMFRVHRRILASPSSVFDDMLDASTNHDDANALAEVKLEESVDVVTVLLGAAYNKPELLATIQNGQDWKFVLDVWEAANKYSFHVLKALATTVLLYGPSALRIYTRASMFDDSLLANLFLEKAANVPLHHITAETFSQLPARALVTLINTHTSRICTSLDQVVAKGTPIRANCGYCGRAIPGLEDLLTFKATYFPA